MIWFAFITALTVGYGSIIGVVLQWKAADAGVKEWTFKGWEVGPIHLPDPWPNGTPTYGQEGCWALNKAQTHCMSYLVVPNLTHAHCQAMIMAHQPTVAGLLGLYNECQLIHPVP